MLNKSRVAKSFSRAAPDYDAVAYIQREAGEQLMQIFSAHGAAFKSPEVGLDLGCGTGYFTEQLRLQWPTSSIIGLDIAEGMLAYQQSQARGELLLCGDAESLPLIDHSVDIIFSNFALQWCENLPHLFAEIARVLSPGGHLLLTGLGPKTLWELKAAWAQLDSLTHVNHFTPLATWQQVMESQHLRVQKHWVQEKQFMFRDLKHLARELKCLGASNMNTEQRSSLTGKRLWQQLEAAYPKAKAETEGIPASYEIGYWWLTRSE